MLARKRAASIQRAAERASNAGSSVSRIKRPIFEFVDSKIRPNDALQLFPLPDDYSFGVLQSGIHWLWFVEQRSTLKVDFCYTSDTVFDAFPWPQSGPPTAWGRRRIRLPS
jgi:hypothetical protein